MEFRPSNYLLDNFISADLSSLTENNTIPYSNEVQWVNVFLLNATLRYQYEEKQRIYLMNLLRRIESTFHQYNTGSYLLDDFLCHDKVSISTYLSAVVCIETSISHLYQAYMLGNKMVDEVNKLFIKNEGSSIDRLNTLYNVSKHYDSTISSGIIEELNSIPIWITNQGIKSNKVFLDFKELHAMMGEMEFIANELIK
ncbi:hypothetical protein ACDZ28_27635 [Paenibacillus sp. RS8]|uniref:hypothetical protein n=1 Tax=Paenibacillus sp. RS8 TaxID=3242681 RepID=UPI0035BED9FB